MYVLVGFLDFVVVLFQSGAFEYALSYGGGLVAYICKTYLCTPKKLFWGAKNEVARDVWEFQHFPLRVLSRMVKCTFIPEDKHAIIILENYGL